MPPLILIVPLLACYLDIARPFVHHHAPIPDVLVLDLRNEAMVYELPTLRLMDRGGQ